MQYHYGRNRDVPCVGAACPSGPQGWEIAAWGVLFFTKPNMCLSFQTPFSITLFVLLILASGDDSHLGLKTLVKEGNC